MAIITPTIIESLDTFGEIWLGRQKFFLSPTVPNGDAELRLMDDYGGSRIEVKTGFYLGSEYLPELGDRYVVSILSKQCHGAIQLRNPDFVNPFQVHDLKCLNQYFREVWAGRKKFELRLNDRDYRPGDYIVLSDYDEHLGVLGPWMAFSVAALEMICEHAVLSLSRLGAYGVHALGRREHIRMMTGEGLPGRLETPFPLLEKCGTLSRPMLDDTH